MCAGGSDIAAAARSKASVHFDEVMDALRALDEEARRSRASPDRRLRERPGKVSRGNPDEGRDHTLS